MGRKFTVFYRQSVEAFSGLGIFVVNRNTYRLWHVIAYYYLPSTGTHTIIIGTAKEFRGHGRPRRSWADDIAVWIGRSRVEAMRSAQDREG